MRMLIVEDETELSALVQANLRREGYAVDAAATADEARAALATTRYDVVLLDLGLPDEDGLGVLRDLRARRDGTPVIVLTARDAVAARVRGLNAGADDYMAKPFALEELVARIGAILRRPGGVLGTRLELANLAFDTVSRDVTVDGGTVVVPRRELAVLEALLRRAGRVVAREALEGAVYAFDEEVESNALEAHVSRLRKRLAEAGARLTIHTVRGVGYLAKAEDAGTGTP
ncbi:MAG TPA: response regulator transcription factor [Azospirillum sp.]|nr:response regulator transcription factor [Azospirillum sp.]